MEELLLIWSINLFSKCVPTIEIEWLLSEHGNEKAVPMDPAPKINIFAINYYLKINLLIKYITVIISILPNIIKSINDIFVKLFKSKKLKLSKPYNAELTVFVSVSMDNLKELSKVKLSKLNMLDKINIEIIKKIKTKKAIFTSWSSIVASELYKFLSITLIGLTNL